MKIRRGALIGFGNVAEKGHLPAWRAREDVQLVAVVDADPGRRTLAARLMSAAHVFDEPSALFDREKIDFVDIATPPALHAPLIVQAARHGCDILCEKPLTTSMVDHRVVTRAVREAGVTLFTVHNWKHSEQFRRVEALVRSGAIGKLRKVRFETIRDGQSVAVGEEWRTRGAIAGGGILVDHGWHTFYLMLELIGEVPQRVRAVTANRRYRDADVEDSVDCAVDFPTSTAEVSLTWAGSERKTSWRIEGDAGSIEILEDRLELRQGAQCEAFQLEQSLSAGSHHPEWFSDVIDGFLAEVDGAVPHGANLAEAERCLTLLELAYQSARRGGEPIALPTSEPSAH